MPRSTSNNSRFTKISNYLSQNHLSLVTIVLTASAIILTIWLGIYYNKPKLSFQIIDESPLINLENIDSNWEVRYKHESVKNPFSIIYNIKNIGQVPIKKKDFENPISIEMGKGSKILDVNAQTSSLQKKVATSISQQSIKIEPFLLNPENSLTIKFIVDNYDRKTTTGLPTAGIPNLQGDKIEQVFDSKRPSIILFYCILFLSIIASIIGILAIFRNTNNLRRPRIVIFLLEIALIISTVFLFKFYYLI